VHLCGLLLASKRAPFGSLSLRLAQTSGLVLLSLGVHLLLESPLAGLFSLGTVDVLNKSSLVLESVTLAGVVKLMVEVLVDLARGTVLD